MRVRAQRLLNRWLPGRRSATCYYTMDLRSRRHCLELNRKMRLQRINESLNSKEKPGYGSLVALLVELNSYIR
jgi:uncharacterized protein YpiB (UPF0302 family)